MTIKKFLAVIIVDVPEGATHYHGNLHQSPTFFKQKDIGVAGEHWFGFTLGFNKEWWFVSHHKPHWIEELPEGLPEEISDGDDNKSAILIKGE